MVIQRNKMFQDTVMPRTGNELDRLKKKLKEQEIINRGITKNHNSCYVCIRIVLQYAG